MTIWQEMASQGSKEAPLCFACGQKNPIGLKLKFRNEDGKAVTEFTPSEHHQGWPNVAHAGITCTMLDEAIGYAAYYLGIYIVTTKLNVRLIKPTIIGKKYIICAEAKKENEKKASAYGTIKLEDGTLIADVKAEMHIIMKD
ncbi:MAG: PaaI family thioesterase [Dehalococcoidia bacterium]|jgi:acyl-coenzyme A thioesterase PaaI-like protein